MYMENVQYEFREELSMDEEDEYVEGFIINEEEHEDIESFEKKNDEIIYNTHLLF